MEGRNAVGHTLERVQLIHDRPVPLLLILDQLCLLSAKEQIHNVGSILKDRLGRDRPGCREGSSGEGGANERGHNHSACRT